MNQFARILLLFTLIPIALLACSSSNQEELTNEKAKQMIDAGEVEVIDVRSEEEYSQGHLQHSLLIPLDDLQNRLDELDKNQPYLVVCRTGNRSSQAAEILKSNGFTSVYNLKSGLSAWSYPLES
ncbi:rhodanese-like domain-containing protein [Rossellomorea vietnamensis]|uniref:Rhodanese-like domain-containing protein n=1 Tax=Rossellomorea vietnamensis TaxID=218284 RepID=A0A5D4MFY2_9BACI|nr:rhodanese-like domain-containing protein [Rossellomorea vietnamensis]TYS00408.1 rhodanese-like domain-containing protein [Rossellomorea vietnamensis]